MTFFFTGLACFLTYEPILMAPGNEAFHFPVKLLLSIRDAYRSWLNLA